MVYAVQNMLNEVLRKLVQAVEMSPRAGELTFLLSHRWIELTGRRPLRESNTPTRLGRMKR